MLTSITVSLKNINQRITEILPFYFNRHFPRFSLLKCSSQRAITANIIQCFYSKIPRTMLKRNSFLLSVTFPEIEYFTCRV